MEEVQQQLADSLTDFCVLQESREQAALSVWEGECAELVVHKAAPDDEIKYEKSYKIGKNGLIKKVSRK